MLKRSLAIVALTLFATNAITACGSSTSFDSLPTIDNTQQVQAQSSFFSIKKEIEKAATAQFKDLDKNKDKMITPEEYNVKTPDEAKAFYAVDKNHDGKVTLKEMIPGFFAKIGLNIRLEKTAEHVFKQLDKNHDHYVNPDEVSSGLLSTQFVDLFKKYDTEKAGHFFNKNTKGQLSESEFEKLYAHVALNAVAAAPPPAPAADSLDDSSDPTLSN
jgi:Ca2+-binding EF-hand superfamily protein